MEKTRNGIRWEVDDSLNWHADLLLKIMRSKVKRSEWQKQAAKRQAPNAFVFPEDQFLSVSQGQGLNRNVGLGNNGSIIKKVGEESKSFF
jgi:hypothetical protein